MPMDSPPLGPALESITAGNDSQGIALQDSNPRRNDAQPVPQSQYVHLNLDVICLSILVVDGYSQVSTRSTIWTMAMDGLQKRRRSNCYE